MNKLVSRVAVWGLFLVVALAIPAAVNGQAPPPVRRFVSNLDVRCYQIPDQPSLGVPLHLDHLNPVFVAKGVKPEDVVLKEPQSLCVPVQKNDQAVPPDTLPFIQFVDWKCYGIGGPSIDLPLHLDHLNPVIAHMFGPSDDVIVREPQQLCVPVAKDDKVPPADVLKLIQWLDVKCYRVEARQPVGGNIWLTHLNPLLANGVAEPATIVGPTAIQLCVPVAKNQRVPPPDVLRYIQYSDDLCYALKGDPLNRNLKLTHLNPVLIAMGLPPEYVFVGESQKLCVPVAKNGNFPPGIP